MNQNRGPTKFIIAAVMGGLLFVGGTTLNVVCSLRTPKSRTMDCAEFKGSEAALLRAVRLTNVTRHNTRIIPKQQKMSFQN
mmetsp:Transcript_5708/g.7140  ORF Transcript_5708/g.7140 Transcript_5708/m.7140 type:complete len:81 (-) Transcript_5708:19-261(-)